MLPFSSICSHCLLLLCGDIAPNPGPSKYPCTVCHKRVTSSQRGIECSQCERWTHALCASVSDGDYIELTKDASLSWFCPDCSVFLYELPYANLSISSCSLSSDSISPGCGSNGDIHHHISCCYFNACSISNKR